MDDDIIVSTKRSRADELKRIAKERKVLFDVAKLVQHDNILECQQEITNKQFICIAVLHQLNIPYIRTLLEIIIYHGPQLALFTVFGGMFVVGLPLFMLYTFLGHYSRRGYMKVWDCVPLLRGLGYSVAIVSIFSELYNVGAAALAIFFIPDLFSTVPWTKCPEGTTRCVERGEKFNKTCDPENLQTFTTQSYMRIVKLGVGENDEHFNIVKFEVLVIAALIWVAIWFFSYQGFQRFSNITIKLCCSAVIFVIMLGILVLGGYRSSGEYAFISASRINFDVNLIGKFVTLSCIANDPGTIIFVSAIAPGSMNTGIISAGIFAIKISVTVIMIIWFVVIIETIHVRYGVLSNDCISMGSHDILFPFILDVLIDLPLAHAWIFMFLCVLAYIGFVSVLYTITAALESIMEVLPRRMKKRTLVSLALCSVTAIINTFIFTPSGVIVDHVTHLLCLRISSMAILLVATAAIIFLYPISILVTDIYFLYSTPPHKYWITAWTICPMALLLGLFVVIFHTDFTLEMSTMPNNFLKYMPYGGYVVIIFPLVINGLFVYIRFIRSEKKTTLLKPDKTWGPRGTARKMSRAQFRPDRDLKYRNPVLRCKHKCSISSQNYRTEKLYQAAKYKKFVEELNIR